MARPKKSIPAYTLHKASGRADGNEGIRVRLGKRFLIESFVDPLPGGSGDALKELGDLAGLEIFFEDEVNGTSSQTFGTRFGHIDIGPEYRLRQGATRTIAYAQSKPTQKTRLLEPLHTDGTLYDVRSQILEPSAKL